MTAVELGSAAPTGLLERERELAAARDWLGDVRADRGGMLLVEAPAGLGKSALIEHVREIARGEFLVLRAGGSEMEQDLGWGVARSLFEPWLRRLSDHERADLLTGPAASALLLFARDREVPALPVSDAGFAILHGLYWLAVRAAESQPILLVIDDAHWADEPSLRLLGYLLSRIRDHPVGLLVAARSGEAGAAGLLAHVAAEREVAICELGPLSAAAVTTLIREQLPEADTSFCRRCWELTAGNPLGVREVLMAIAECPPAAAERDLATIAQRAARSLSRSVLRRLASLSPEARALADAVSVFEVDAELPWAAALAELEPTAALAALDRLERADILSGEHELVFTTRCSARPSTVRCRAGAGGNFTVVQQTSFTPRTLGRNASPRTCWERRRAVMARWSRACATPHSARWRMEYPPRPRGTWNARCASRRARRTGWSCWPSSAGPRRASRRTWRSSTWRRQSGWRASRSGAPLSRWGSDGRCTMPDDRRTLARRSSGDTPSCRTPRARSRPSSRLGTSPRRCFCQSAPATPIGALRRSPSSPGIASTPAGRLLASRSVTVRVREGQPHDSLVRLADLLYEDGLESDRARGDARPVARVLDDLPIDIAVAGALGYSDQYERADAIMARALEEARRVGWVTWSAAGSLLRARFRLWTGPIGDVIGDGMAGLEVFDGALQMYLPAAAYCLARGLIESDEYDEADEVVSRVESGPPSTGTFAAWQHEARGRLAAATGDWEQALGEFLACGKAAESVLALNPAMFHWRSEGGNRGNQARPSRAGWRADRTRAGAGRAIRRAPCTGYCAARHRAARERPED